LLRLRTARNALAAFLATAAFATAAAGSEHTLAELLARTAPGRGLERVRVRPYGWLEVAATTTPGHEGASRRGRAFDDDAEGVRLHQAYLAVERVPLAEGGIDVGGRVALLAGTDARLVHSRGLLDEQTGEVQLDLLEARAMLGFPAGEGVTLSLGKFPTPLGYEVVDAPSNPLVSESFLFTYAVPFAHVGALLSVQATERVRFAYGLVQGWDVWEDDNDSWSHLGTVAWTSASGGDAVTFNGVLGPEGPGNDVRLRGVLDATWVHSFPRARWTAAVNSAFGFEDGAAQGGDAARWWGAAGYLTHRASDRLAATLRVEGFRDEDGARVGESASLLGVTLGLEWRPLPRFTNLRVRPEVRWDHSLLGPFFDDGADEDQVSLTLDVLLTF
jgi:hypothetical protein